MRMAGGGMVGGSAVYAGALVLCGVALAVVGLAFDFLARHWQAAPGFALALLIGYRLDRAIFDRGDRGKRIKSWASLSIQAIWLGALVAGVYGYYRTGDFSNVGSNLVALLAVCAIVTGLFSFVGRLLARLRRRDRLIGLGDPGAAGAARPAPQPTHDTGAVGVLAQYLCYAIPLAGCGLAAIPAVNYRGYDLGPWEAVAVFIAALLVGVVADEVSFRALSGRRELARRPEYLLVQASILTFLCGLTYLYLSLQIPGGRIQALLGQSLVPTGLAAFVPRLFAGAMTRAPAAHT